MADPIVMISSYPPRLCGIGTFCEEAREFIQARHPKRDVLVISHTDGQGEGVFPLIDMSQRKWWKPVAAKLSSLKPYAVHIQHEYGLYEYFDDRGQGDKNEGFIDLLDAISDWPLFNLELVVERNPDVIFTPYEQSRQELLSGRRSQWASIEAVRQRRVHRIDQDTLSRPGPRLIDAFELIARLIDESR